MLLSVLVLALSVAFGAAPASAGSGWVSPIAPPTVVAEFDRPAERWSSGHRGVDLAGTGTVRASADGVVTFAGPVAGRGVISISHGRLRTTYEPVEATVVVGESVAAGQPIGSIGAGGHCGHRCVHWGLLAGDEYLDPMLVLATGPPVLKSPANRTDMGRRAATAAALADPVASGHAARVAGSEAAISNQASGPVRTAASGPPESQWEASGPAAATGAGLLLLGGVAAVKRRRRGWR